MLVSIEIYHFVMLTGTTGYTLFYIVVLIAFDITYNGNYDLLLVLIQLEKTRRQRQNCIVIFQKVELQFYDFMRVPTLDTIDFLDLFGIILRIKCF